LRLAAVLVAAVAVVVWIAPEEAVALADALAEVAVATALALEIVPAADASAADTLASLASAA